MTPCMMDVTKYSQMDRRENIYASLGVVTLEGTIKCNIIPLATIFTSELTAIWETLSHVENEK